MTKAADALAEAGHAVRVVSTCHTPWAVQADRDMRSTRSWSWRCIDYRFDSARAVYLKSGLRGRFAKAAAARLGAGRVPFRTAVNAYARVHPELVGAALEEPVDLFYGGTTGALAATAEAAARSGTPYGLDLEDFHSEEQEGPDGPLMNQLGARILTAVVPAASFLTSSSGANATEYARRYGVEVASVYNTFPLPAAPPALTRRNGAPLSAYWFGQTIGEGRGLEDFIRGAVSSGVPVTLHLRGRAASGYIETLQRLASVPGSNVSILVHAPAAPDRMVQLCGDHDVGLALEDHHTLSRELALSNKALTYILAGLAVVLTDTKGQQELAGDLDEGALLYRSGDHGTLAQGLRRWYEQPARLLAARQAAWSAAVRRWHWEHPSQRGTLLTTVNRALA